MDNIMLDLNHWRGAEIAAAIECNVIEAGWLQMIFYLKPDIKKDGDQWCYILGELPEQNCIVGFGDTPRAAMIDFCKNFNSKK